MDKLLNKYYCYCNIDGHKYYCDSVKEPPTIYCQKECKIINLENYGYKDDYKV